MSTLRPLGNSFSPMKGCVSILVGPGSFLSIHYKKVISRQLGLQKKSLKHILKSKMLFMSLYVILHPCKPCTFMLSTFFPVYFIHVLTANSVK